MSQHVVTYNHNTVLRSMYCHCNFEMLAAIMLVGRDILESSRYAPTYQRENIGSVINPYLLTWRICRAPNNASKWQIGFNSAFKV